MSYTVEILITEFVTHDVKLFWVTRPEEFDYQPGQGVTLAVNESNWNEKKRPCRFTPTKLGGGRILGFTIKGYSDHDNVTRKLHSLQAGVNLLMSDAFGAPTYQSPGWFIADGAGITPMMAMLRKLAAEQRLAGHGLIFANRTPADIICEKEFQHYQSVSIFAARPTIAGTPEAESIGNFWRRTQTASTSISTPVVRNRSTRRCKPH